MRLTRVDIDGFQCHNGLTLKLEPGFNAVTGKTDAGKSAIVRAIAWALYNEPAGKAFISDAGEAATVKLWFDNGCAIERIRSRRVNRYIITTRDDEITLDDFGRGLCSDVAAVTGVMPVDIVGKEVWLNVQQQHDPPFLLVRPWSGIDRANLLDKVAENDLLAAIVGDLNRDVQAIGRTVNENGERIAVLDEELAGLADVGDQLAAVTQAETRAGKVAQALRGVSERRQAADLIETCQSTAAEARRLLEGLPELPASSRVISAKETARAASDVRGCLVSLEAVQADIETTQKALDDLGGTSATLDPNLELRVRQVAGMRTVANDLEAIIARIDNGQTHLDQLAGEDKLAHAELAQLIEEQDCCPICGGELDPEHVLKELAR